MWDTLLNLFGSIGFGVFGNTILIGLFILGIFAFFLVKSGKVVADIGFIIISATILLLARYGFLPNYFFLLVIIGIAGLFYLAVRLIFSR